MVRMKSATNEVLIKMPPEHVKLLKSAKEYIKEKHGITLTIVAGPVKVESVNASEAAGSND